MSPRAATSWSDPGRVALALIVVGLVACLTGRAPGADVAPPPVPPWESALGRDHPLAGRVWDPPAARFVTPTTLVSRLTVARFVLLGEKHDNADHHRLQAWALQQLFASGRRPAVALEMLTV